MRKLLWVILALALLATAGGTGCSRATRYDARLVAADSLAGEGDRAYRDLLLTQARYRCYITATTDSDINRALAYYRRRGGEREKLTRAYIYKGAVMEELGHPDSAMLYYKHAEATAAPDDHFNLGYTNLRIGELYQSQISQDSAAIMRLRGAIKHFEAIKDTTYLIASYGDLGSICGVRYPDSTEFYLTTAIELSIQYKPSLQYSYKSKLAGFKYYMGDYYRANTLAMDVLHHGKETCDEYQFYYYAAMTFLKMGLLDSAKYILSITPAAIDRVDSMNYLNMTAEIAKVDGKVLSYSEAVVQSKDLNYQIITDRKEKELITVESNFDISNSEQKVKKTNKRNDNLMIWCFVFALIAAFLTLVIFKIRKLLISLREENLAISKELNSAIARLEEEQRKLQEKNLDIYKLVGYRIDALNLVLNSLRFRKRDDDKKKRRVLPISSLIDDMETYYEFVTLKLSDSFWNKLRLSVDGELADIVTYVEYEYPNLKKKDIRLFCLLCAKLSPQIIRICMNYTSTKTVRNYKNEFVKKKLGLCMSLDEFIDKYVHHAL